MADLGGIKRLTPGTKREGVVRAFLERGERGLTCFEAVRIAHDYVLRTTVSELTRDLGIQFHKRPEAVPALGGTKTANCVRYWLTAEGEARAKELLADVGNESAIHA